MEEHASGCMYVSSYERRCVCTTEEYVYVSMYRYLYILRYICVYIYMYASMYVYVCLCIYEYMPVYTWVSVGLYVSVCMYLVYSLWVCVLSCCHSFFSFFFQFLSDRVMFARMITSSVSSFLLCLYTPSFSTVTNVSAAASLAVVI